MSYKDQFTGETEKESNGPQQICPNTQNIHTSDSLSLDECVEGPIKTQITMSLA